jgi:TonB family protein
MPEHQTSSRLIWVFAAIGAVAIHVGCVALAVAHLQTDDPDEDLGARAIEVSFELAAPRAEPTDLPPGPDAEASAASAAVQAQKAVVKETELPKDIPTETDDPDRVVTPTESKKPEKEEPEVATPQASPSEQSIAVEATAMPSSQARLEAPRATAPAQGIGESKQRVRVGWQKELVAHLDRHKRYPADREAQKAEVVVGFELDRTGHIVSTSIVKGSGDASFDEAALAMLRRSDPVPPPPPLIADDGLSFTVPVIFRVKGGG